MNISNKIVGGQRLKKYVRELFAQLASLFPLMFVQLYPLLIIITVVICGLICRCGWLIAIVPFFLIFYALCLTISYALVCGRYKRISPFFTAYKFPLFKCSFISQKPCKKDLKGKRCAEILKMLSKDDALIHDLKPNWTYLMETHQTVIDRLRQSGIDNIRLWACFKQSLISTQKGLLGKLCKKCPDAEKDRCRFIKYGTEERQFYFVIFHTSPSV